jgi:hypothetical protein
MTWLDLFLVAAFATLTALGAKRKLAGLVVGLVSVLLFKLLLVIFSGNVYIGLVFALLAGLLLGLASRFIMLRQRGMPLLSSLAGGFGGALLGLLLVLSVATSFPLGRDVNNFVVYPDQTLPGQIRNSQLVNVGRDILLYPSRELNGQIAAGQKGLYQILHNFFVVGKPWEGDS